jgi:cobalt-zinc-cadmium efflux system membrane fusion protein
MVPSAVKRLRNILIIVGVPAAALAAVLLARMAVNAQRPQPDADVSQTAETRGAGEATSVRLDRTELRAAAGIEVESVQSRSADAAISCNASASFNQNKYVKVPPKADGILAKINVDVGAAVRAGDVLAVVNSQTVGELKKEFINGLVHEEHLRWQVDRYKAAADGVAAKNLFEAQHLLEEQLTESARIRARLNEYGFAPPQVEMIAKAKDINIQLSVVAPRDGVIVYRQAVEGEPVTTTTPLFAIADLNTMWVQLYVYESSLPQIHLGQNMTFFPDGLPGQGFTGAVTWISPEVDPQTRTIQLRAEVANREGALRANMFGKGKLLVDGAHERLMVPQTAVQSYQGQHVVFVQKPDNLFELRPIVVGLKGDAFWEVTSGLQLGEKVATTGSFLLKSNLENPDFGKVE